MRHFNGRFFIYRFVLALCALGLPLLAHASGQVTGPNGEYKESHTDLTLPVLGGAIAVERSWLNGRWYFNPAWADLRFTYDALDDGSIRTIDRAGSVFESSAGLYVFDDRFFIRKTTNVVNGATIEGWRWNDTSGNWVEYDSAGKIAAYGDRNDIAVRFVRNGEGKIGEVRDHRDAVALSFTYTDGKLTRITDRAGRFVEYLWTGSNLTTVTDVLGYEWTYSYDGNGQIKGGSDPEERSWSLTYLQSYRATGAAVPVGVSFSGVGGRDFRISRVATFKNEAEHTTRFDYDYDRSRREWSFIRTYPSGRKEASVYNLDGRVIRLEEGNVVTYRRIKDGDRIDYIKDERGQVTRREYDGNRNLIKLTYPDGTSESWTYHPRFAFPTEHIDARATRMTYRYDDHGNRIEMIEAVGEPEARTTTYAWNALGQMTSMTIKGATEAEDATTAYTYDDLGNIDTITDAEQITTHYTHHVTGQIQTTTDGREKVWTDTYNAAGWLKSSKNPIDPATTFGYDKVGNRKTVTDPASFITRHEYDGLDRLVKTIDAKQGESRVAYNADGNVTREEDASHRGTTREYDLRGRLWKTIDDADNVTERIYGTAAQALEGLVAATQYPTYREEYKYDARGRRTQVIRILDAENREVTTTSYDANGNAIAITDPLGRTTLYAYDRRDRHVETTGALGGKISQAYDQRDNRLSLTDTNRNTHRFTYDRRNRVMTETRPLGQTRQYHYDANGNVSEEVGADRQKSITTYDGANRRIRVEYFEASSGVARKTVNFDYDIRGLLVGYDDQVTSAVYRYDELRRKTAETLDYGPFTLSHGYTYTASGRKESYTAPDGTAFGYSYAQQGPIASITIEGTGDIVYGDFQWNHARSVTYPGGVQRTLDYDPLMRLTAITMKDADGDVLMDYAYRYDAVGNVLDKTTEHGVYRYGYDALDRLVTADYPNGTQNDRIDTSFAPDTFPYADDQFVYDAMGNRLQDRSRTGTTPWRFNANNELIDSGFAQYAYDDNGNRVAKMTPAQVIERRNVYNTEERLSEIKDGNGQTIATYYYDPFGRRLWKTVAAHQPGNDTGVPITTYLYYTVEGYAAEYTYAGAHPDPGQTITPTLQQLYLFAPRHPWSTHMVALKQAGSGWRFPETDHLGTPHGLIDAQGTETQQSRASAFGITAAAGEQQPIRFAGQTEDPENASYYNFHRNYEAATAVYTQSDPIGLQGGLNIHGYAQASPQRYSDPQGLAIEIFPTCGGQAGMLLCNGNNGFKPRTCSNSPCTRECTVRHENKHVEDYTREFPRSCDGKIEDEAPDTGDEGKASNILYRSECNASRESIACASAKLDGIACGGWCSMDAYCCSELSAYIGLHERHLKKYECAGYGW